MYARQGYLYAQNSRNNGVQKALGGAGWTKYYCQYVAKSKTLTMIPYSQLAGKITTTETIRVGECVCKEMMENGAKTTTAAAPVEKYKFVVTGEDLSDAVGYKTNISFPGP
jgi:hypothetical protein